MSLITRVWMNRFGKVTEWLKLLSLLVLKKIKTLHTHCIKFLIVNLKTLCGAEHADIL